MSVESASRGSDNDGTVYAALKEDVIYEESVWAGKVDEMVDVNDSVLKEVPLGEFKVGVNMQTLRLIVNLHTMWRFLHTVWRL